MKSSEYIDCTYFCTCFCIGTKMPRGVTMWRNDSEPYWESNLSTNLSNSCAFTGWTMLHAFKICHIPGNTSHHAEQEFCNWNRKRSSRHGNSDGFDSLINSTISSSIWSLMHIHAAKAICSITRMWTRIVQRKRIRTLAYAVRYQSAAVWQM